LRNYLLDRHFQLKYSGYLVGTAVVLSAVLGVLLWRTSRAVISQSQEAVAQSEQVVELGRAVVNESRKVSAVVQMNIVKDPVYRENPELLDAFNSDARKQEDRLTTQQQQLESQSTSLRNHSAKLALRQRMLLLTLCVALSVLVVGIGLVGIVITHKVAGPIFKMKGQIRAVGEGHLRIPGKLRRGDELVDFFDTFDTMVRNLRARQAEEIAKLDSAIAQLEGKAESGAMLPLNELRKEMQAALD
jgi:nitrogen fixation/metabolism regulation signal transduction histidine kinase